MNTEAEVHVMAADVQAGVGYFSASAGPQLTPTLKNSTVKICKLTSLREATVFYIVQ